MTIAQRRRLYVFVFDRLHLPRRLAILLVKSIAFLAGPGQYFARRRAARAIEGSPPPFTVPQAAGYRKFQPGELPGAAAAVAECRAMFAAARDSGDLDRRLAVHKKRFLVPVAEDAALISRPAIAGFALSRDLLAVAVDYLGAVPILAHARLLWTPVNDSRERSQLFHLDAHDFRQFKVFLHVFDVDGETGPLTFMSASASAAVCAGTGYAAGRSRRLEDDAVERYAGEPPVVVTGPTGAGVMVDTSRCLHFGSRGNRKERLVLFLQYSSYYAPEATAADWRGVFDGLLPTLDGPRRLLLRW